MKGASQLISTALIVLFVSISIALVMGIGIPTVNRAKETVVLNEGGVNIRTIDGLIKEVASEGVGSFRSVDLRVTDGEYRVFNYSGNYTGSVEFSLSAKYNTLPLLSVVNESDIKYSTGVIVRGLVGYWKFDEGTSTMANDSSGYGHTGTPINSPTWTAGRFGGGVYFNKTLAPYINVGDPADGSLDFPFNDFSFSAWVYTPNVDTSSNVYTILSKSRYSTTVNGWVFAERYGQYVLQLGRDDAICDIVWYAGFTTPVTGGVWQHTTVTINRNGNATLYINGVKADSVNISSGSSCDLSNSFNFTIGSRESGDNNFNGTIDEVRIYNRALTSDEITSNYGPKQSDYRATLEYDKIYIAGSDRLGKGTQKLCIEKIGTYLNRPLIKISKCG